MKIRDIMRTDPFVICETDALGNAQRWMKQLGIRHLPVVTGGRLVGLLSERDLLAARARGADEADEWWRVYARDAMDLSPQTAHPDDSLTEVAGRMATSKRDAFPVVERGRLVGIVTVIDVLDAEVRLAMARPTAEAPIGELGARVPALRPDQPLLDAVAVMHDHHVRDLPVVDKAGKLVGMLAERDIRRKVGDPAQYCESTRSQTFDVEDAMDPRVPAIEADRPIAELAHYFSSGRIDAVPIVDRAGALVGVVSYIDALHALARSAGGSPLTANSYSSFRTTSTSDRGAS